MKQVTLIFDEDGYVHTQGAFEHNIRREIGVGESVRIVPGWGYDYYVEIKVVPNKPHVDIEL